MIEQKKKTLQKIFYRTQSKQDLHSNSSSPTLIENPNNWTKPLKKKHRHRKKGGRQQKNNTNNWGTEHKRPKKKRADTAPELLWLRFIIRVSRSQVVLHDLILAESSDLQRAKGGVLENPSISLLPSQLSWHEKSLWLCANWMCNLY
jgi:hypothetical protein